MRPLSAGRNAFLVRILVTISPRLYWEAIALSIHRQRPDFEVLLASPDSLEGRPSASGRTRWCKTLSKRGCRRGCSMPWCAASGSSRPPSARTQPSSWAARPGSAYLSTLRCWRLRVVSAYCALGGVRLYRSLICPDPPYRGEYLAGCGGVRQCWLRASPRRRTNRTRREVPSSRSSLEEARDRRT